MNNQEIILLFDGICNLCNAIVQFTLKRDPQGKFKFAALQSEYGQAALKKFGLPTDDFDSFVVIIGDECFLKSSAALNVFRGLDGGWKLLYGFIIFPRPLRDLFYLLIAKSRYRIFGKCDTCMLPAPDIQDRFLP